MGNSTPPPVPPPPKTIKELVKDFSRTINKLKREFNREIMKMEMTAKKIRSDLEKSIKNKEPKTTQRMLAAQLLRNQQYVKKYQRLDAQMSDLQFQLNQAATTETLVQVMTGMNTIMKQANSSIDIKNVQYAIESFGMEVEKQEMLQEQIGEIMNQDQEEYDDENADNLIMEMEAKMNKGAGGGLMQQQQQQPMQQQNNAEDLDARLKNL